MPRPVFSLWMGGEPTAMALASMGSFTALGHPYTLYAYDSLERLPPGVVLANVDRILSRRKVGYLLERRAYSMVSNLFRYTRLRSGGLWVDTDVIALREFDFPETELLFGWQDTDSLNGAVLGAPPGHPMIAELHRRATSLRLSYAVAEAVQPRAGRLGRIRGTLRHGRTFGHAEAPWGTFGPQLITQIVHQHGLMAGAQDRSVFYPIRYQEIDLLLDPGDEGDVMITPAVYAVHLWNEVLRRRGIGEPPAGSLLERLTSNG